MPRRGRWNLQRVGAVLGLLWALSAIPVAGFYQSHWSRIIALPKLVRLREEREGGRWTSVTQVSPWLVRALIATEDRTFYSNLGVSFEGIARSLLVDLRYHQLVEGGSTLTQQLVRDTLLSPQKTFRRKISEALLAVMLTALYSKREILSLYLNEVYLGNGFYGIGAASYGYFGVPPGSLTIAQATLVAGLPQAPSAYDPLLHYRAAKVRQWQVLTSMVQDGMLSWRQANRVFRMPLGLRRLSPRKASLEGPA
ncbi:MAG: transglycosylase domain-containing protein [Firmicutes bacterium]|nr:transglycosylase domain-containing protein [Bacillota bacterium]